MIVQEPVQAAIWHCLNHYAYQDATFLAERLCSEVDSDESVFTLATCYYRSNQIHQAYWALQSKASKQPQCRYLLAKCAFDLKKFACVETALINDNFTESRHLDGICGDFGEVACFALQLIAKVCTQTERHDMAAEANRRALQLNPFLWQSFADLCNRGHKPDAKQIFQFTSADTFATCQGHNMSALIAFHPQPAQQQQQNPYNHPIHSDPNGGASSSTHQTPVSSASAYAADLQTPLNHGSYPGPFQGMVTPNNHYNTVEKSITNGSGPCGMDTDGGAIGNQTPFRKQFKYLSSVSPSTPSFGFLPMSSPADLSGNLLHIQQQQPMHSQPITVGPVAASASLTIGKKLRGPVAGSLISRKDTPLQLNKPIFSQTGGNITPRTPSNNAHAHGVSNAGNNAGNNTGNNSGNNNSLTGPNVRRSSRLSFSNCHSAVKENNKISAASLNKFAAPRSPPRKSKQRITKMNLANSALNELNTEKLKSDKSTMETCAVAAAAATEATASADPSEPQIVGQAPLLSGAAQILQLKRHSAEGLMALLRELGNGYAQLTQYNCADAIDAFGAVAPHHQRSTWVQSMVAKAHYELHEYEAAARIFQAVHQREPHRTHLMEIYSTVLWHLHREVALSALAQDLVAQDKLSPVTWCVSGNCFSLHKEHETAIKFFERAVQVDPEFAYSYTLLGHELVITEELDKAMSCFRTAILKDTRHYNAWFGIGTIFSKQERYSLAEIHYRHALCINPRNSVIMVHIGTMQFALKQVEKALHTLNTAIRLDPKNPLCKFHRGSMYFQMGKDREALAELKELKQLLPKESVVYYLIGKIHKKMGNVAAALKHFSWATDLDPRGANNQIKDAFDTNMSSAAAISVATPTAAGGGSVITVGTQVEPSTPVGGTGVGGARGDAPSAASMAAVALRMIDESGSDATAAVTAAVGSGGTRSAAGLQNDGTGGSGTSTSTSSGDSGVSGDGQTLSGRDPTGGIQAELHEMGILTVDDDDEEDDDEDGDLDGRDYSSDSW